MVMHNSIRAEAAKPSEGMSIDEFLEFSHAVERALTRGDFKADDIILSASNVQAKVRKLSIIRRDDDKGKWNVA